MNFGNLQLSQYEPFIDGTVGNITITVNAVSFAGGRKIQALVQVSAMCFLCALINIRKASC